MFVEVGVYEFYWSARSNDTMSNPVAYFILML